MVFRNKMVEINSPYYDNLKKEYFNPEVSLFIITDEANYWITEEDIIYYNKEGLIFLEDFIKWENIVKMYMLLDEQV